MKRTPARMRYRRLPHRCVKCEHRKTLSRPWVAYTRPPKCEACGYHRLYPCRDRLPHRHGRIKACNCGGYHFQHRKGSKYCHHNPNAELHWIERSEGNRRIGA